MSVPVDLAALEATAGALGDEVVLVTVDEAATPHVVSVLARWSDGTVAMHAGRRTAANVEVHPTVTLLWPTRHQDVYRLIVDGTATLVGDSVVVQPAFAVLHRIAGATGDGPTCLPVER